MRKPVGKRHDSLKSDKITTYIFYHISLTSS